MNIGQLLITQGILFTLFTLPVQHRATTSDLRVTVLDQSSASLPGVTITARNTDTGHTRGGITGPDGRLVLPALSPGAYRIHAHLQLFTPRHRDIVLSLGEAAEVVLVLAVSSTSSEITVEAAAPDSAAPANVVSQRQIDNLPINARYALSLALIAPGVGTDRMPQQGASATSGLTFAGQRARSNNISVDGVDNTDPALGSVRATFSQEAVREFQVLTSSFPAEFGKASGGVVNIITRSGTNRPSGSAFFYLRDELLNAREYFEKYDLAGRTINRPRAPFGQRQLGGTLGGPLRRDKTFYFQSFEHLAIDATNFVGIDDQTPITLGGAPLGTPKQILERTGFPVETGNVPYNVHSNSLLTKVDHLASSRQNMAIRFSYGDASNENSETWGGQVGKSRGGAIQSRDYVVAASHIFAVNAALLNELRFQYAHRDQNVISLDPACGGPCRREDQGGPTIEVTGFAQLGRHRFTPQPRHSRRWQLVDTLSYYSGPHHFKTGFDASIIRNVDESLPLHFGGRYVFAASLPGEVFGLSSSEINAIQAVALGAPSSYVQGYGNSRTSYTVGDLSVFAQDDWQLVRGLTLKWGVRYQKQFWPRRFPDDKNNIAPRIAFAWDVKGNSPTVVHGAYGIFFDHQLTILPAVTRILDGVAGVRTLAVHFPSPVLSAAWNSPGRRLAESASGAFPSMKFTIDPGLRTPFAHHVSTGISQTLNAKLSMALSLVVARGHAQLGTIDYNPIVPGLGGGRRPEDIRGVAGTSASILQFTSFGRTWYKGLTLSVNKPLTNRYQLLASYTLSKAEDTTSDYQSAFIPQNNGYGRNAGNPNGLPSGFEPFLEKGASLQDQRHRFVLSGSCLLPAGIQASAIGSMGSGRPYSILAGVDLNGDGNGGAFPTDRARALPDVEASALPRNSGTLPGQGTIDVRLSRRFSLRQGAHLEVVLDVFNLLNRTNFTDINNVFGPGTYPANPLPAYGQFTQTGPSRHSQVALRLGF